MKKFRLPVLICVIALLFSGCSFRLASSVDELISPISPDGDNASVQTALESYAKNGFSLKTPTSGDYTTSYIFYDINNDGSDDAIAFYEPASNLGTIDMAVIMKKDNDWSVVQNIEGDGTDIYSINFCDLTGDNNCEIVVLWNAISNSTSHNLSVYTQKDENGFSLETIGNMSNCNAYIPVDMNSDSISDLMVFTIASDDSVSSNAKVYSYNKGSQKEFGTTKLDGHISTYTNIISGEIDGDTYVYADALKSNGNQLTEIIYWSDYYNTIISPFYSYSSGVTKSTTRVAMLTSRDINDDGEIDVPLDASFDNIPDGVEAVNWKIYKNDILTHSCYTLAVEKDAYQIIVPDDYFDEITVSYDAPKSEMVLKDKDEKEILKLVAVLKTHYDENSNDYKGYSQIMTNSGYVYLAKCGNDSNIKITNDDLKNMIKVY